MTRRRWMTPRRAMLACLLALTFAAAPTAAQQSDEQKQTSTTASTPSGPSDADLRRVLVELKEEPSIQDVQKAALEFYNLSNDKISGYHSRAGWKSAMPKVTGEFRTNSISIDVDKFDFINAPDRQAGEDLIGGSVQEYKAVATWDLPKLIYNPEVLDVYTLKRYREQVVKEATRLFFLRRRIQIDFMLNPPADPQTYITKKLRIDEVTAMLDAMTGGMYTQFFSSGE